MGDFDLFLKVTEAIRTLSSQFLFSCIVYRSQIHISDIPFIIILDQVQRWVRETYFPTCKHNILAPMICIDFISLPVIDLTNV